MSNLQQQINSILSTTGVMAGLYANSPVNSELREAKKDEKRLQVLNQQQKISEDNSRYPIYDMQLAEEVGNSLEEIKQYSLYVQGKSAARKLEIGFPQEKEELLKRKFDRNPTQETYQDYIRQSRMRKRLENQANFIEGKSFPKLSHPIVPAYSLYRQTRTRQDMQQGMTDRKEMVRKIEQMRAQGMISNRQAKSMTYKAENGGGQDGK